MATNAREFLKLLEEKNELVRVNREVDSRNFELPAVIRKVEEDFGKAVIFENVKDFPGISVMANVYGSMHRIALGLGLDPSTAEVKSLSRLSRSGAGGMAGCTRKSFLMNEMERASAVKVHDAIFAAEKNRKSYPMQNAKSSPAKEIVIKSEINISKTLPIVWHCMEDRGPFITPGVWVSKDPDTGQYGMGVFRGQVTPDTYGPNRTGALFSAHSDTLKRLLRYEEKGEDMPIAICFSVEPAIQVAAVYAAMTGIDEFQVAGALNGRGIEMVGCDTIDLMVPASSEIVLEGRMIANMRHEEGPMAEFTDYCREERAPKPVFECSAITHRRNPIYHTLMTGMSDEHRTLSVVVGWGWEGRVLEKLKQEFPTVKDVAFNAGSDLFHLVVSMDKKREGDDLRLLYYIFGLDISVFAKYVTIVDEDIDVHNPDQVEWARCMRAGEPNSFVVTLPIRTHNLDPMGVMTGPPAHQRLVTTKLGIIATQKVGDKFRRPGPPDEVLNKLRIEDYLQ
jgi:2,5-furandicarboxylate decarboxylase 1